MQTQTLGDQKAKGMDGKGYYENPKSNSCPSDAAAVV